MHICFSYNSAQKFRDAEDGRSRIDEIVMFILKRLYVELSFVGTRYIQWRCWMLPDEVNVNEWNPGLMVRLECFILCNVNVSDSTIYSTDIQQRHHHRQRQ